MQEEVQKALKIHKANKQLIDKNNQLKLELSEKTKAVSEDLTAGATAADSSQELRDVVSQKN